MNKSLNGNESLNGSEPIKVIKKETIQRLLRDVKLIMKHPLTDNGIYYSHDENDLFNSIESVCLFDDD